MVKVGVCLSGCGFLDGSEIHEATLALFFLDKAGAQVTCMAPSTTLQVVNHRTKQATGETRNVLDEAARIARGNIRDVATVKAAELDALVLPGGFGAAKNLCDFASAGAGAEVNRDVARRCQLSRPRSRSRDLHRTCSVAAAFKGTGGARLADHRRRRGHGQSAGGDGATHVEAREEFRVDEANLFVTTPAYMYDARISEVAAGIEARRRGAAAGQGPRARTGGGEVGAGGRRRHHHETRPPTTPPHWRRNTATVRAPSRRAAPAGRGTPQVQEGRRAALGRELACGAGQDPALAGAGWLRPVHAFRQGSSALPADLRTRVRGALPRRRVAGDGCACPGAQPGTQARGQFASAHSGAGAARPRATHDASSQPRLSQSIDARQRDQVSQPGRRPIRN